jgi:hypothetical protein
MADDAKSSSSAREILQSAYTLIRSTEVNKAYSGLTLDHAIQEQIDYLKKGSTTEFLNADGGSAGSRISRWDQLDALEQGITTVVKAITDAGTDSDKLAELGIVDTDEPETTS